MSKITQRKKRIGGKRKRGGTLKRKKSSAVLSDNMPVDKKPKVTMGLQLDLGKAEEVRAEMNREDNDKLFFQEKYNTNKNELDNNKKKKLYLSPLTDKSKHTSHDQIKRTPQKLYEDWKAEEELGEYADASHDGLTDSAIKPRHTRITYYDDETPIKPLPNNLFKGGNNTLDRYANAFNHACWKGNKGAVEFFFSLTKPSEFSNYKKPHLGPTKGEIDTGFLHAARNGHHEIMRLLLEEGADVNTAPKLGRAFTALMQVSAHDLRGPNHAKNDQEFQDYLNKQKQRDIETTKILLEQPNIDIHVQNMWSHSSNDIQIGDTALIMAKRYENYEIAKLIENHIKNTKMQVMRVTYHGKSKRKPMKEARDVKIEAEKMNIPVKEYVNTHRDEIFTQSKPLLPQAKLDIGRHTASFLGGKK